MTMKFGTGSRAEIGGGKEGKMKPGPGAYNDNAYATLQSSPKFGFGTGLRTEEADFKGKKFVPGPGSYMSKSFVGAEGSKITMHATLSLDPAAKEGKAKPGPG